jgi:hypothetical protein
MASLIKLMLYGAIGTVFQSLTDEFRLQKCALRKAAATTNISNIIALLQPGDTVYMRGGRPGQRQGLQAGQRPGNPELDDEELPRLRSRFPDRRYLNPNRPGMNIDTAGI